MLTALILAENPAFGRSLKMRLQMSHRLPADCVHMYNVGESPQADQCLSEFHLLYKVILKHVAPDWAEGTAQFVVITDLQGYGPFKLQNLNPLGSVGWATVLGMLVLALPEVHWVFAGCSISQRTRIDLSACVLGKDGDFSTILAWVQNAALCPLFDALGVRNEVRQVCRGEGVHQLPVRRSEQAAAVDEEREYAFFHSYVAYRFGFCCHVVSTSNMMERLFSNVGTTCFKLIFEDLFLNFADRHIPGISDLRSRDQRYERLASIPMRVIVSTGYELDRGGVRTDKNRIYLNELRAEGKWNVQIPKPVAGVYRLWEASGIGKQLRSKDSELGAGDFFRLSSSREREQPSGTGHSTPGRLLEVAKRLLDRAALEPDNPRSACATIHRAVLATDALEILGGRTATTSLIALTQSHELEALAECQFLGVEGDFDVDLRLLALRKEIKTLSVFYNRAAQEVSAWNAESSILQRLTQIFRDHNKFSEEQVVLIRERELFRRMWFRKHFGAFGGSLRWLNPAYVLAWYVDVLLRSISFFVIAIVLWILLLTVLYSFRGNPIQLSKGFGYALLSFFSLQASVGSMSGLLVEAVGLVGLLHVGVLITHLYAVTSRR